MEMHEKEEAYMKHYTWMYAALKIMKNEGIAGVHGDSVIKYTKKKKEKGDKRTRETDETSPKLQAKKNIRTD